MRFRPVYALLSDLKIERPGQIVFAAHLDLYAFIDAKCGAEKK